MKTLFSKPLQTAAVLLLALGSCKKEGQRDISRHQPLSATSGDVSLLTYYDFGTDILEEDFLLTVQNDDELQYNYVEYALTTGLLEIFHNHPGLLQELVTRSADRPTVATTFLHLRMRTLRSISFLTPYLRPGWTISVHMVAGELMWKPTISMMCITCLLQGL